MIALDATTVAGYVRRYVSLSSNDTISVRELPGGVSNAVFLVTVTGSGERFVLKQAREKLRVQEEWRCPVERIWREVETLRICGELVGVRSGECGMRNGAAEYEAAVPRVLWDDPENFCYAMSAAPEEHRTWKEMLLAGEAEASLPIAEACGRLLGTLHAGSWNDAAIASQLDDRSYFDQLRVDPYYRQAARVHADLAPHVEGLIESVWKHRRCLVHGDFSPKNLLVWPGQVLLIDFEVGHYGDPAFDLGFFLTHLLLKSLWAGRRLREYEKVAEAFWSSYRDVLAGLLPARVMEAELADLEQRAMWNLAGCMLARVDGKSPVEYLSREQQGVVRRIARSWISDPPAEFAAAACAWVESLPQ